MFGGVLLSLLSIRLGSISQGARLSSVAGYLLLTAGMLWNAVLEHERDKARFVETLTTLSNISVPSDEVVTFAGRQLAQISSFQLAAPAVLFGCAIGLATHTVLRWLEQHKTVSPGSN